MPVVRLSDSTFEKLQRLAIPLQDTVDSVVARLANAALTAVTDDPRAIALDTTNIKDPAELWSVTKRSPSQAECDLHDWRRQFWAEILKYIVERQPPFQVQAPNDDHWSTISIGRSNITIVLTLTPKRRCVGCELYVNVPWKAAAMDQLESERDSIEKEIGYPLKWDRKPGKKSASIYVEEDIDPKDESRREEVKQWMHKLAVRFYSAFHERVMALKAH
jgi:hypothetical protein